MMRQTQTERGIEAVKMLADFLEKKSNLFNVSIFESGYSVGVHHYPDLVFRQFGVEVKRIEFLVKTRLKKSEDSRASLNNLKIYTASWDGLKDHCSKSNLVPILVAVVTLGRQPPIFVGFSSAQVDEMRHKYERNFSLQGGNTIMKPHNHRKSIGYWFGINSFAILREGAILNNHDAFIRFFMLEKDR